MEKILRTDLFIKMRRAKQLINQNSHCVK